MICRWVTDRFQNENAMDKNSMEIVATNVILVCSFIVWFLSKYESGAPSTQKQNS